MTTTNTIGPLETPATSVDGAVRVDPRTGVREEVRFFGPDRLKMFGCLHLPASDPVGGVVICSSIQAEFLKNLRREVLLGRALSQRGLAVVRWHYRGAGNSDGSSEDMTFHTMRDDTVAATRWLQDATGVDRLAFAGTRWGGLVAATVAGDHPGAPLALWEPAADSSRYFREVFRSRQIRELKEGSEDAASSSNLVDQLNESGTLDVLGYSIDKPLYESAQGHTLAEGLGDAARPILLIQIGRSKALRGEYRKLVTRWQETGSSVSTHVVEEELAWWFAGEQWQPEERRPVAQTLITETVDWVARQVEREAA
jgi:pimeloyl-ACP methyl ester carboxylesterase